MYKVILTVIHNVRRFVGDSLLPKVYTVIMVISFGVFFYVAATLKSAGEVHQIEPNIAISSLSRTCQRAKTSPLCVTSRKIVVGTTKGCILRSKTSVAMATRSREDMKKKRARFSYSGFHFFYAKLCLIL